MADTKNKVKFEYERSVIDTAEGELVAAMITDMGQMVQRGTSGQLFRKIYGTDKEVNVQQLRDALAEQKYLEKTTFLIAPRKTETYAIDSRITTPERITQDLVNAYSDKNDPVFRNPKTGKAFVGNDFQDPSKLVPGSPPYEAYRKLYGEPPQVISEGDLQGLDRLAVLGADLGVSIDGVDLASLPQFQTKGSGGTKFNLSVVFNGMQQGAQPSPYAENVDWFRTFAQRPGGQNYSPDVLSIGARVPTAQSMKKINPSSRTRPEEAYAVLRIFRGYAPDSADPFGGHPSFEILFQTNRFLLENVQEQDMERMALIETFGEPYLYLFGSKARVWSYSGTLFDTQGLEWLNEWRVAFQRYMKGTQSTKMKARAILCFGDVVREGVIVASAIQQNVGAPGQAQFSFQMFVIREHYINGEPKSLEQLNHAIPNTTFLFSSKNQQQNVKDRYDITYEDITPNRETVPLGTSVLGSSISADNKIAHIEKLRVEQEIQSQAFVDGSLVHLSGSFALGLGSGSQAVLRRAAQDTVDQATKLRNIPAVPPGSKIQLPAPTASVK